MTTPQAAPPEEGSNLPTTLGNKPMVELTIAQQQALELRRTANFMAAAIANLSWGKNLDERTRRAIADFGHRYGIDPITEIDLLGGGLYVNSEYYLRRLGELRQQGVVKDFWLDHINADDRLIKLFMDEAAPKDVRERARAEHYRRVDERIRHNAPEQADAICVCNIVLASGGHPVQGVKWGGNGTSVMQPKGGGGSAPNPVVEANPELSVESQSVRRAMRQVASYIPAMAAHFATMDVELKDLSDRARAELKVTATRAEEERRTAGQWVALPAAHEDPYGLGKDDPRALGTGAVQPIKVVEMPGPDPMMAPPARGAKEEAKATLTPAQVREMPREELIETLTGGAKVRDPDFQDDTDLPE